MLTLMRVDTFVAPSWPDGPQHQQMHLDVAVDELESTVPAAIALDATEAAPTRPGSVASVARSGRPSVLPEHRAPRLSGQLERLRYGESTKRRRQDLHAPRPVETVVAQDCDQPP